MGEFPGYVWWWDFGEKDEMVRKRVVEVKEKMGFDVPVADWFGETKRICVQMAEGRFLQWRSEIYLL